MEIIEEIEKLKAIAAKFELWEEYFMLADLQEEVEADILIYH
ncbi:hypothetical protein ACES2J_08225 [Bdellovibrio bacteriovorus]